MEKLRFGLVGAGAIAQTYAQAFADSAVCTLAAITDVRADSAQALAEITGGRSYTNLEQFESAGLDAVIVATPPSTHADIVCWFLERGISVLCEKPLCINSSEARRMIDAAENNKNVVFTMASKFRYCEDVVRTKSILASGMLGDILQFENAFTANVDMSSRWNSDPELSGGGVLIDNGTHSVDIIRYLLGPIGSVLVVDSGRRYGLEIEENVKMLARTATGITASVDLTWGINKELPFFISIYGTNGVLHVGWRESFYKLNNSTGRVVFGRGYDKVGAFRGKIDNFGKAVCGKEPLLIGPEDALASVQVIEAAYRSMQRDLWQPVDEKAAAAIS